MAREYFMNRWLCIVLLCILSGCLSKQDRAVNLAHGAGWQWDIIPAGSFDLATAQPVNQHGDILWVYLEGDGRAYLSPTRPSSDPTPTDPISLRLALAHPYTSPVAYLARPCQYVLPDHGNGCTKEYWTNARYAPEVIDSTNNAIDNLKKNVGASQVVLVGYSGGGALAVLVAAKRNDVMSIITVVANLDLAYWTGRDGLSTLTGSVDPATVAGAVANIPQVHFTGGRDHVTGTDVAQAFIKNLPANAPAKLIEMPDYNHICCWVDAWPQLITEKK